MRLSPKQALDLENKLNKTVHKNEWSKLGDKLYDWRLSPQYNHVCDLVYKITEEQMRWVFKNAISDNDNNKCYELTVE